MSTDPDLLALIASTAATLRKTPGGRDRAAWLDSIGQKIEAGIELTADETMCITEMQGVLALAAADTPTAATPSGSLITGPASTDVSLTLTAREASALQLLLSGQTDPTLAGISAKITAAENGSAGTITVAKAEGS